MSVSFSATNTGFDELIKKMQGAADDARGIIEQQLINAGFRVQRAAKKLIQDRQGVGCYQVRYDPKRVVIASAPGQPPNTDTGILVNSIYVNVIPADEGNAVIVGTDLLYGKYLELGTVKMLARPWLFPAYIATADQNRRNISKALDQLKVRMQGGAAAAGSDGGGE